VCGPLCQARRRLSALDESTRSKSSRNGKRRSLLPLQGRDDLFSNRVVWARIGYEGSSLEFGGYVNRGLNDIDY
jgi:hypothetical protein